MINLSTYVKTREFALADLACVVAAGIWWVLMLEAGVWPLVLFLMPWAIRLVAGKFPFQRTALDIPILIFLVTLGVGVWAAYNRTDAWNKFWLITSGVLLYYALAGQPRSNWRIVAGLAGVLGAGISIFFLFTHDWAQFPADLSIINRLGKVWISLRPDVNAPGIHPNIAGGLLAMLFPVNLAIVVDAWQKRDKKVLLVTAGFLLIHTVGLLMSSSRAAWLALVAGLGMWGWWLISGWVVRGSTLKRMLTFCIPILLVCVIALSILVSGNGIYYQLAKVATDEAVINNRMEIAHDTTQLIRDFPYTGGGLASFSGLYSTYIRVIQVPLFFYSHNLYTDIALEQGLPGLAAFIIVLAGTGWILLARLASEPSKNYLTGACLVSLTVVILHGFMDDALYGMGGTPLLFLIPGLIANIQITAIDEGKREENRLGQSKNNRKARGWLYGCLLALIGIISTILIFAKPLTSAWYANHGAVAMSRLLGPYPFNEITTIQDQLEPIIDLFEKSLTQDPHNPTSLYRYGIIMYNQQNFKGAVDYLESANSRNPNHRGIQKLLGYAYTWVGDALRAENLLITIPETVEEMDAYTWWWSTQERADLSKRAEQMATRLRSR